MQAGRRMWSTLSTCSWVRSSSWSSWPNPRIALSGVRSSWLMRDRNSLLAVLARSASRLASSAVAAAARSSACSRALISATPVCWASDCSTNRSSAGGSAAAATTRKPACPAGLCIRYAQTQPDAVADHSTAPP